MADNKTLQTRIKLKYDTLANWTSNNPKLLAGEVALTTIDNVSSPVTENNIPAVMMKVGDGSHNFKDLPWLQAPAADVYAWAKESTLKWSTLDSAFKSELQTYIETYSDIDSNTQYQIVKVTPAEGNEYYKLQKKDIGEEKWSDVDGSDGIASKTVVENIGTKVEQITQQIGTGNVDAKIQAAVEALNVTGNISDAVAGITVKVDEADGKVSKPVVAVGANAVTYHAAQGGGNADLTVASAANVLKGDAISPIKEYIDAGDLASAGLVSAEETRAKAAEQANANAIAAEVTRAQKAEGDNAAAIEAEASRADAAEKANADAISAEATAARQAEAALAGRLDVIEGSGEGSIEKALEDANDYTDSKIGTLPKDADTVVEYVTNAIADVNGDNEALADRVKTLEGLHADNGTGGKKTVAQEAEAAAKAEVAALVGSAPEALDTLEEIAEWIAADETGTTALIGRVTTAEGDIDALEAKDIVHETRMGNIESAATALAGRVTELEADSHTHDNKDLLDSYTQTEANLADAVAKKHEHSNKAELDLIASGDKAKWDGAVADLSSEITRAKAAEKANSDAIAVLNGNASTEGSVAKAVADEASRINAITGTPDSGETLQSEIDAVEDSVAVLNGSATTAGSVAKAVADEAARINAITGTPDTGMTLQGEIDALEAIVGNTNVPQQIKDAIEALDTQSDVGIASQSGKAITLTGSMKEVDGVIAKGSAADITLADVASTGKIEDLSQDAYVIFDCGSSSLNI